MPSGNIIKIFLVKLNKIDVLNITKLIKNHQDLIIFYSFDDICSISSTIFDNISQEYKIQSLCFVFLDKIIDKFNVLYKPCTRETFIKFFVQN